MELSWNGIDITDSVNITGCVHRESASGKSDCLELTLDHASRWYGYAPEEDDEIILTHGDYSTGKLYLNAVIPVGDQYRILATSVKRAAARRAWASYADTTLKDIFDKCGAECGMEGRLYGVDGRLPYPFALRQNEGAAAFLNRIGEWEGLCVKARNGAFLGVSVLLAQERDAETGLEISAKQEGVTWRRRDNLKYTGLTIQTPWASATARDADAKGNNAPIITCLPAMDNAQAGRWARGLLLMHNRKTETLTIDKGLDTSLVPLAKVEVSGGTAMSGDWLVDNAEHDIFNGRTTANLLRVIESVK